MTPNEAELADYQRALIEHLLAGTLDSDAATDDPALAPFREALANADPRALAAAQNILSKWVRRG